MQVEWTHGLNVLIGETGAGKSILIDALSILLGAKIGPWVIRAGSDKCYLEGVFEARHGTLAFLKQEELIEEHNPELVVSREVTKSGSRFRCNGVLVNQSVVQELRQQLISMHAQNEARTLLSPQAQLELLDSLGDKAHAKLVDDVRTSHEKCRQLASQLKDLQISEDERLRRLDFARFQFAELQEASLNAADEDEVLLQEELVLAHASTLDNNMAMAQNALDGDPTSGGEERSTAQLSVIDLLQNALSIVEKSTKYDQALHAINTNLESALASIEEATTELRRYRERLDTDPETLNSVQSRLALLDGIKRKYGPTLGDAMANRDRIGEELARLEGTAESMERLQGELAQADHTLSDFAAQLTTNRQALSATLCQQINKELADLGMERCQFEISFEKQTEPGSSGYDRIEFLIAPNPGQQLAPLAKIASGGELSRVMLAIKTIFAGLDQIPTVIFDEIDTGLSGKTLQAMRDKLAHLAKSHQILCITHQPIIAAVADNHLQIQKEHLDNDTRVFAKVLDEAESLKALASMASGSEDEEVALSFAKSLVEQGKGVRRG